MVKWFKRIALFFSLILGIGILLVIYAANASGQSQKKVIDEMREQGVEPTFFKLAYDDHEINTIYVGDTDKKRLLFIHGSPGDWTAWSGFLTDSLLLEDYLMVSYDRAGFGETTLEAKENLAEHGETAAAIMHQFGNGGKWIVVGHSYGGAVAGYLMATYPNQIEKVVFAAPAISPDHQEPRWYNKLARMKLINWIVGKDMRASNVEMIGLSESLRALEPEYTNHTVPHVFIHGNKDVLVPYQTVDYWRSLQLKGTTFVIKEDMNHFIPWSDPDLILKAIKGS